MSFGQLEEMSRQCADVVPLLRRNKAFLESAVQRVAQTLPVGRGLIVLAGSGDSAGLAAQVALRRGGVLGGWWPAGPHELAGLGSSDCSLIVAISASGGNPPLADGVRSAAMRGVPTVAVSCRADSSVVRAADRALITDLGQLRPAPAVTTYLLGLVALDALAAALRPTTVSRLLDDRTELPDLQRATETLVGRLAGRRDIIVVAPWASLPSAGYLAAKLVEVVGVRAHTVRGDDWIHVHRFATDSREPVLVWAPVPDDGAELTALADRLIRPEFSCIGVTPANDPTPWPVRVPVNPGSQPEIVSSVLAARVALELGLRAGREPFSGPAATAGIGEP